MPAEDGSKKQHQAQKTENEWEKSKHFTSAQFGIDQAVHFFQIII